MKSLGEVVMIPKDYFYELIKANEERSKTTIDESGT